MATATLSAPRLEHLHRVMAGHVDRGDLPGIVTLVSRRGETHVDAIGTKAFDTGESMRTDTLFRIASMTKPVTAAAAMLLVEECTLRLDDPVDPLLPELAEPRVLRRPDSPLDDTVPANRPVTVRDLLTFRLGTGAVMAPPGSFPIQDALDRAGLAPGPERPAHDPDDWIKRLGELPLIHQPGERWMYDTGTDVLGVLIARASGRPLEIFLRERLFEPLGMVDTGFAVPASEVGRLATVYQGDPTTGATTVWDDRDDSAWTRSPVFPSGSGGLVSTAGDYLAFARMLLDRGRHDGGRILSRPSVEVMTTDQLTDAQKAASDFVPGFWDNRGWGLGMSVMTRRDGVATVPGQFGWDGGYGTSAYADPAEGVIGVLMTQRLMDSPNPPPVFRDFWTCTYRALDD